MGIKLNLNTSPYYDDFAENKEFYKVLFRPGFSIQARELTTLQTILQNQVEKFGTHMFEEGAMVIPGHIALDTGYHAVKLKTIYSGNTVENYVEDYIGTIITGHSSGIQATVVNFTKATLTGDPLTLYVKYKSSGKINISDTALVIGNSYTIINVGTTNWVSLGVPVGITAVEGLVFIAISDGANVAGSGIVTPLDVDGTQVKKFFDNENISADGDISTYSAGTATATTKTTNACVIGSSTSIAEGVYFTRGHFVKCQSETIFLDKYTNTPSYRIGFDITESLVTPEGDTSLLDNATGVSNFAAKGAHRLGINLKLVAKELTSIDDTDFIELLRVKNGAIQSKVQHTQYAIMEETLARRTYDESGDYTVQDFDIEPREHLNTGLNLGIFPVSEGGDSSKIAIGMSPGKAYVRGFEIETLSTQYVDVDKARNFDTQNNTVTPAPLGNYVNVFNTYGTPDITKFSTVVEPFRKVQLYDTATVTRGSSSGNEIGFARVRAMEHSSGAYGGSSSSTDGIYKLYLFDIQMKTILNVDNSTTYSTDARITGSTSGAYGYVVAGAANVAQFDLVQVSGTFLANEILTSSDISDTTGATVSNTMVKDLSLVKQIFMDDTSGNEDFTCDLSLNSSFALSGTLNVTGGSTTITGSNTFFMSELKEGDVISIPSGASGINENVIVALSGIISNTQIIISGTITTTGSYASTRKRSKLNEQEELVAIYKLPKSNIKTLLTATNSGASDTSLSTKRQYIGTSTNTISSSEVSFTTSGSEVFGSFSLTDYILSVLTSGTGTLYLPGDIVDLNAANVSFSTSTSTSTITIDDGGFGTGCIVKLIATIEKTVATEKQKTAIKSEEKFITYTTSTSDVFGSRISDVQISLGTADVYNVRAIYESVDINTTPEPPTLTLNNVPSSVTFNDGDIIVGSTTTATGGVISYTAITSTTGTLKYYPISGVFSSTENIKFNVMDTATITAISVGDTDIISSFTFDTGQRDSFYDIASIHRKGSSVIPNGQLLIIYDYFIHSGSGDYFSVDSYNSVEYTDIPSYSATRVDPDTLAPSGNYELRDCLDFRSRVADNITTNPFIVTKRDFISGFSSTFEIPKVESLIRSDFENYLNRIDNLYLTEEGDFVIQKGVDAEEPINPNNLDSAMKLAEIEIPAYTHSSSDVGIIRSDNSRYTMRDIGKLEKRIGNLEYYTSLNMLEQNTQSLQIIDSNGFDRFKSGFIADNFSGHSIGDVIHLDYQCSIDFEQGILRPESYLDNIDLLESNTSDTQRVNSSYTRTGDLILLPYTDTLMISQAFASRVENVNPFAIQTWIGVLKMSPDSDTWIDTKKAPDVIVNVEGNYNSILAKERNRLGTIWNSWKTIWTGNIRSSTGGRFRARTRRWGRGLDILQRTTTWTDSNQRRTGTHTRLIETKERKLAGTKVIDSSLIPFMRSKLIDINVTGMKPNTKIYPFFDNIAVSNYFKTSTNTSGPFVTDSAGAFIGSFTIPNSDSIRFRVGKKILRLTDRSDNNMTAGFADTSAEAIFEAAGTLNTEQSTFLSIRNAEVVRTSVSDTRTITTTRTATRVVGWWDPLAQTFLVEKKGGCFVTKVDLFFQSADNTLPVTMMIRSVENGMPAKDILPFSTVTLNPFESTSINSGEFVEGNDYIIRTVGSTNFTDIGAATNIVGVVFTATGEGDVALDGGTASPRLVNISDDGLSSTTFTFDSPVYLKDREEYCVVVQTASLNYKCWISQVGEKDVNTTRSISEQPYMGVLFKSQNSSTWTASQMEDLKFNLYNAKFDTSVIGNVKLKNEELSVDSGHIDTLSNNPISTEDGVNKVRIYHPNHGMHSTTSGDVIISGVVSPSGETGTLAGIPLTEINKTHTSISDIEIDSYCITTDPITAIAVGSISAGGKNILATRNVVSDVIHPIVSVMDFPETTITSTLQSTTGTSLASLAGTETSYIKTEEYYGESIILNDDYILKNTGIIASKINETNHMNGVDSLNINISLSTANENISPIIDTGRMSLITIANRVDSISSSSDIGTASNYVPSTAAEGDNNPAIYMTKKISIEVPATSLRTMMAAVIQNPATIEVYYKILRTDSADNFDDIGWVGFNTNGSSDAVVSTSKDDSDFKDYLYTVSDLPEFIAFSIKIVMKSTDSTRPPLIKDFRTIALEL